MYTRYYPLHSEFRSSRSPRFLLLKRTKSYPCSALSGLWGFTLSVPPLLDGRNSSLLASAHYFKCTQTALAPQMLYSDQSVLLGGGGHNGAARIFWGGPVPPRARPLDTPLAVRLPYSSLGLQCPIGVRAHSTRCTASSSTFARFYNLEVSALQARVLSA